MKPTIEQKALIAASKPGIDLLLEELRRSHEFFHVFPSHLCWNTPGGCGCFDCFATRGACFNAGWHHEGERGGKVERHRAEGTLALGKFTCCLVIWWTATFCSLCVILYCTLCLVLGGGIPVNIEVPSSI